VLVNSTSYFIHPYISGDTDNTKCNFDSPSGSECSETSCNFLGRPRGGAPGTRGLSLEPLGRPGFRFSLESIAAEYKKSQKNRTDRHSFRFFEGFESQKQPETAQRVNLMLRYVNVDRDESNRTSSWPGEERKHSREAQNLQVFAFLRVWTVRNSQKQHRKLI
jgi:hypothetical protein